MGAASAAALLLFQSAWSDGMEAAPAVMENPPVVREVKTSPKPPHRPLRRAKKALVRGLAEAVQPFFNYSRNHLALLLPSTRHLPPNLAPRPHDDYMIPGLSLIPRGWNTFNWGQPGLIVGNQTSFLNDSPKPIGERGSFQVSSYPQLPIPFCWLPAYFAFTLPNGTHFRLGARWDDIDDYTVVPSVALKYGVVDDPAAAPPPADVAARAD
jgi:hypothetical protein